MSNALIEKGNRPAIEALTVLRFFAALHVVLYHLWSNKALCQTSGACPPEIIGVLSKGYASVSFFFVLSGFILTYNYLDRIRSGEDRRRYWFSRFARVYPVFLVGLVIWAPMAVYLVISEDRSAAKTLVSLAANLALMQSWFGATALSWNAPGWSLSVEAFFYFVFPFLLIGIQGRSGRFMVGLLVSVYLAGMLPAVAYGYLNPEGISSNGLAHAYFKDAPILVSMKFFPPLRVHEFIVGMIAGWAYLRLGAGRLSAMCDASLLLLVAFQWMLFISFPERFFLTLHNGALSLVFAAIIFSAGCSNIAHALTKIPGLTFLGESSYALYIVHGPVLIFAIKFGISQWMSEFIPFSIFYCLLVVGASCACHLLVEKPARSWLINWWQRGNSVRSKA